MTRAPHPPIKSLPSTPDQPRTAEPASAPDGRSAPKDVGRKAVPSALRSDRQQGDGRYPVAWLRITAPPDWRAVPTATSKCACGRDRIAVGRRRVLALIADHEAHKNACPLRSSREGRTAA
ncbi:hypothetical protein [Streptomyces sp. WAC05858]|uniref:hypothetical protein n=1 Tax=Streptomyces TaxID=1883 RepID=UPI000F768038|nr:hypothetical protein [Streptomyces sp. WAC05858]RSS48005.1 hypothetical protein EF902_07075 [Streptomyces sp. WAC05858]